MRRPAEGPKVPWCSARAPLVNRLMSAACPARERGRGTPGSFRRPATDTRGSVLGKKYLDKESAMSAVVPLSLTSAHMPRTKGSAGSRAMMTRVVTRAPSCDFLRCRGVVRYGDSCYRLRDGVSALARAHVPPGRASGRSAPGGVRSRQVSLARRAADVRLVICSSPQRGSPALYGVEAPIHPSVLRGRHVSAPGVRLLLLLCQQPPPEAR